MTLSLASDVTAAFKDANADEQTRVIKFTGTGRAFCSGDDRKEPNYPETAGAAREFADAIQDMTRAIVYGKKVVVGAINGWAVGGGFELAINCDFPIWAESAKGFFPEVSLNASVTGGVSKLLPSMIGINAARELLFTGETQDANRLLELGVAWKVVADEKLQVTADHFAKRLAEQPPAAMAAMKRLINTTHLCDVPMALEIERDILVERLLDPDTRRLIEGF